MDLSKRFSYEGPRTPKQNEIDDVVELARSIFFKSAPSYKEAVVTWPMYLRPELRENTYCMFYKGSPVALIIRLVRDMYIYGCHLRVGYIGSVCTHPDHRERNLAGTILEASFQRFANDNVDIVNISGARSLYYRTGANHVGHPQFQIDLNAVKQFKNTDVKIRKAEFEDAEIIRSLNEGEDVRINRDLLDYELVLENGCCSGRRCIFYIIESGSEIVSYILARDSKRDNGKWTQNIFEFAGDRSVIIPALADIANDIKIDENAYFTIQVTAQDELIPILERSGFTMSTNRAGGTLKVLNFPRTMNKLKPILSQYIDAENVEFTTGKDRYGIYSDSGTLEIDGEANMLWTVLGSPPGNQIENIRVNESMKNLTENCFPIPLPSLTLNNI
ncbi:GNAT family N-acetyltransferase [Candidatus Poribacteria bacterium]|nr:GNAT family N-acetyltransferase [Candidatus Poribacteria bacterium]